MKYEITFSEIIRYRPYVVEAKNKEDAMQKFCDIESLENTVGISDVETEDCQVEEVK